MPAPQPTVCPDENAISAFADGVASSELRAQIEAHIVTCADCRELLSMLGRQPALADASSGGVVAAAGAEPTRIDAPAPEAVQAAPAEHQQLVHGSRIKDTYVIERSVGAGGMGIVYEVKHQRLARPFALKLLSGRFSRSAEAVQRFRREALISSRLKHANIVDVTDFDHLPDGTPYLVMELLEGEDLSRRLSRVGKMQLDEVLDIVDQIAAGLDAAHAEHIVHRDLKPSNVFLSKVDGGEKVKLLDFGLSKLVDGEPTLTMSDATLGTAWYMSPEQADHQSGKVGTRSDVFALGVMTFQMLAGERPFEGRSIPQVLFSVVHREPRALTQFRPDLPTVLSDIIARALAKAPAERPASAGAFARALREAAMQTALVGEAAGRRAASMALGVPLQRTDRRARGRGPLLAVVLLLVGAIGALGAWWWLGRGDTRARGTILAGSGSGSSARLAAAVAPALKADAATVSSRAAVVAGADASPPPPDATPSRSQTRSRNRSRSRSRNRGRSRSRSRSRSRARARARPASLLVQSKAAKDGRALWANVYLDGKLVGQTALNLPRLAPGRHRVVLRRPGYHSVSRRVLLRPGQRRVLRATLKKK